MRIALVVALALLAPHLTWSRADTPQPQEVTLPHTEVRDLHSEIMNEDFRLMIGRPFGMPPRPGGGYPVIYVLDADIGFPIVRQTALSLQSGAEMPHALIVGIAYRGGFMAGMTNRNRDYTPVPDSLFMKYMGRGGDSGGAEPFLRVIREELKPFVETNYPADPDDATLVGFSFGGLFATYAMFESPGLFQRYVVGSPSLWWGDKHVLGMEEQYAASHKDLEARVFIAAGGYETLEYDEMVLAKMPEAMTRPMLAYAEAAGSVPLMVELVEPFVETLSGRSYPGLKLTYHLFPEETHNSVPPMVISRGLRTVFETP